MDNFQRPEKKIDWLKVACIIFLVAVFSWFIYFSSPSQSGESWSTGLGYLGLELLLIIPLIYIISRFIRKKK